MAWLRTILWLGTIAFWIVICVLTHLPPQDVHIPPMFTDKEIHFTAYAMLCFGIGLALMVTLPGRRWIPLVVIAVAMAYGAIDERTQPMMGRDCDIHDWYADVAGACTAALFLFVIQLFVKTRRPSVGTELVAAFEGVVPEAR